MAYLPALEEAREREGKLEVEVVELKAEVAKLKAFIRFLNHAAISIDGYGLIQYLEMEDVYGLDQKKVEEARKHLQEVLGRTIE